MAWSLAPDHHKSSIIYNDHLLKAISDSQLNSQIHALLRDEPSMAENPPQEAQDFVK